MPSFGSLSLLPSLLLLLHLFSSFPSPRPPLVFVSCQSLSVSVLSLPSSPFVTGQQGNITGFTIDLWEGVVGLLNSSYGYSITYTYAYTNSVVNFHNALRNTADVGLSSLSVTPVQQQLFGSSVPYKSSVIRALISPSTQGATIGEIWLVFKSPRFLQYLLLLMLYSIPGSIIIWACERKKNPENYHRRYLLGLGAGIYWSWVTLSTVGYGDKAPKTVAGQIFTIIYIILGIVFINLLTGSIAATITVNALDPLPASILDLANTNVSAIAGSYAATLAQSVDANVTYVDTLDAGVSLLGSGSVSSFIHEQASLLYTNQTTPNGVYMAGTNLADVQYAFLYPPNTALSSSLLVDMNFAIAEFVSSSNYTELYTKYFTSIFTIPRQSSSDLKNWIAVFVFLGVLVLYSIITLVLFVIIMKRHPEEAPAERNDEEEEQSNEKDDKKEDKKLKSRKDDSSSSSPSSSGGIGMKKRRGSNMLTSQGPER